MTLLNVRAKSHPQQLRIRGIDGDADDRWTPDDLFLPLHLRVRFTVDAAASHENAKLERYWTVAEDGLAQSWRGERVWCNPPYSDCGSWVAKAWQAMALEGCECVVMLLPGNRTDQGWWQRHIEPFRDGPVTKGVRLSTRFVSGRLRFKRPGWAPGPKGDRPPFGVVLCEWWRGL